MVLRNCRNVSLSGVILQHTREATMPVTSSIEVRGCQNVSLTGMQIINARVRGIALEGCSTVRIADCTIRGRAQDKSYRAAITMDKECRQIMVVNNFLGRGSDGALQVPKEMGTAGGNLEV